MANLFDSCSLIDIKDENVILDIARYCASKLKNNMAITDVVLNELLSHAQNKDIPTADYYALQNHLQLYIKSKDILCYCLKSDVNIKEKYRQIRKQYYGWMTNKTYFELLKSDGKIDKSLNFSDMKLEYDRVDAGECSLLAVALSNPSEHTIVSEDSGRTHHMPSQNLFEIMQATKGIKILKYSDWKELNKFQA